MLPPPRFLTFAKSMGWIQHEAKHAAIPPHMKGFTATTIAGIAHTMKLLYNTLQYFNCTLAIEAVTSKRQVPERIPGMGKAQKGRAHASEMWGN